MMSQQTQSTVTDVSDPILSIQNASVTYDEGDSYVLNDVSLDIERNEIIGVVGESGSGKSMFAETILDAIPDPGLLQGKVIYRPDDGRGNQRVGALSRGVALAALGADFDGVPGGDEFVQPDHENRGPFL